MKNLQEEWIKDLMRSLIHYAEPLSLTDLGVLQQALRDVWDKEFKRLHRAQKGETWRDRESLF